jgi:hypothetical protein
MEELKILIDIIKIAISILTSDRMIKFYRMIEKNMYKRFHKSDTLIYQYNLIEVDKQGFPTVDDFGDNTYRREMCVLWAANDVNYADIIAEESWLKLSD